VVNFPVMAVNVVKVSQLPKRKRNAVPRIMRTADWAKVLKVLAEGSLGPDEALLFTITREEMTKYKIKDIKAAVRPVRKNLRDGRSPYKVSAKTTAEGGALIFRWINPRAMGNLYK
jgi:hypothetical protein